MPQTDVSVIVPVYNTMPYLTRTLESLVGQTIGLDRMQVIAVDDGSTDGSGDELDRFARDYPDTFVVEHQPNSGGPATPCNRGLELATGRYVFFLGADDYLGDEALERLVTKADEWESDVIFGRMVGVGGRNVYQGIFEKTERDLDLHESELAFALSNTKLYRRELVTRHGLHFARDLRVGSDQPFTIEAVIHAKRVSVLGDDYTYYYAVRRDDATNISYSMRWKQRVEDIGAVMQHVADLLPPGRDRDAFLRRHFAWELGKVLRRELPAVGEAEQAAVAAAVAELADRYLTDRIADGLGLGSRLAFRLAQAGDVDNLRELVTVPDPDATDLAATRPLALDGDRVYAALPGFRDGHGHPDAWYDVTDKKRTRTRVKEGLTAPWMRLDGHVLVVTAEVPFTPDSAGNLRVSLVRVPPGKPVPRARRAERGQADEGVDFPVALTAGGDGSTSSLQADVDLRALLTVEAHPKTKWSVRLRADAGPSTYDLPVPMPRRPQVTEASQGLNRARFTARGGKRELLFLQREQLSADVGRRLVRRALNR